MFEADTIRQVRRFGEKIVVRISEVAEYELRRGGGGVGGGSAGGESMRGGSRCRRQKRGSWYRYLTSDIFPDAQHLKHGFGFNLPLPIVAFGELSRYRGGRHVG
jgi:hypothetical protein